MIRITAKQRREAIDACLCRADEWTCGHPPPVGGSMPPLGHSVFHVIPIDVFRGDVSAAWLEAAALLRGDDDHDPWSPGDPVYLLAKDRP